LAAYPIDTNLDATRVQPAPEARSSGVLDQVLERFGGMSFSDGLYRLHRPEDVAAWNRTIATAWSEDVNRITVFAYDWLGRQFALFGQKMVLSFSAGDLEFVEIPADPVSFHNEILTKYRQDVLAAAFYNAWREAGGAAPMYGSCAGYKRPLFLGGEDWIENLELIDMDVYWTVSAPVIAQARKVGVGGSIGQIEIRE